MSTVLNFMLTVIATSNVAMYISVTFQHTLCTFKHKIIRISSTNVTFSAKTIPFGTLRYFEKYHFNTLKPFQFSCAVF